MVRNPSVDKNGMKKGAWSEEEDNILSTYVEKYGHSNWRQLPKFAGLARCGKSCRLRWLNYLKPGLKKGIYSKEEEELIIKLQEQLGNKWSIIASKLPGRTDNEIKNYWHTHLRKRTKQADPKPCESMQTIHLPNENKKPSVITKSKNDQECINDIDDNSFLELYDIFRNELFLSDASNTMISPSAGSCNSTISFSEPSRSFLKDPFFLDATNCLISPSAGSCNSTISFTEPSGSFLDDPFFLDVTNSLISPSSSYNSTSQMVDDYKIILEDTIPSGGGGFLEASNTQVFPNSEESITGSGLTEPFWLSTFYQVLSSSSTKNEGLNLSFFPSDGYDLFNHSH